MCVCVSVCIFSRFLLLFSFLFSLPRSAFSPSPNAHRYRQLKDLDQPSCKLNDVFNGMKAQAGVIKAGVIELLVKSAVQCLIQSAVSNEVVDFSGLPVPLGGGMGCNGPYNKMRFKVNGFPGYRHVLHTHFLVFSTRQKLWQIRRQWDKEETAVFCGESLKADSKWCPYNSLGLIGERLKVKITQTANAVGEADEVLPWRLCEHSFLVFNNTTRDVRLLGTRMRDLKAAMRPDVLQVLMTSNCVREENLGVFADRNKTELATILGGLSGKVRSQEQIDEILSSYCITGKRCVWECCV
jgi:hypothetical protein